MKQQSTTFFKALLSIGTNQGDRQQNIKTAYQLIEQQVGTIAARSNIYTSEAWGMEDQPDFYNTAIQVQTTLSPQDLLKTVLSIENEIGRVRKEKWGPRIIDIDILFYEKEIINEVDLIIPHPHIPFRNFVLIPLLDIAPEYKHPSLHLTIDQLYWQSGDDKEVFLMF